jgi:diguanylate cyclase (GGDEF)-like protein
MGGVGWIGRALLLIGLATAAVAVTRGRSWAAVAAVGGFVTGLGLAALAFPLASRRVRTPARALAGSTQLAHTLDLLRRAHAARIAWAVGLPGGDIEVSDEGGVPHEVRNRGAALVQLASADSRAHVAQDPAGTLVAVGDFPFAAGALLTHPATTLKSATALTADLRRMLAAIRLADADGGGGGGGGRSRAQADLVARQVAALAGGAQTVEGLAKAGVELAERLCQRGAIIVLRQGEGGETAAGGITRIVAVSPAADKRLSGLRITPEAPVMRAIQAGLPVVTQDGEDVFGADVPERRRREREGTAYPLVDGSRAVGALVVVGPPLPRDDPKIEQVGRLVAELGPRLAAAEAVYEAEQRAVQDPLTGLVNRREFERRLAMFHAQAASGGLAATLIYVDLDYFKQLNDTHGHAAGDAALKNVAGVLLSQIREGDLVARIGGEEFAVWLPRTPPREGVEVAERIRRAIETAAWRWSGLPVPLTASCGVACYPEPVGDFDNLRALADAALYRAKRAGRNRVEIATAGG